MTTARDAPIAPSTCQVVLPAVERLHTGAENGAEGGAARGGGLKANVPMVKVDESAGGEEGEEEDDDDDDDEEEEESPAKRKRA